MNIAALLQAPCVPTGSRGHPNHTTCDRDARLRIQTLRNDASWGPSKIVKHTTFTLDQVKYALSHRTTPQKTKSGRKLLLNTPTRKALVNWVSASRANRRVPWGEIPRVLGWNCKVYAIASAFEKEGYGRWTALKKPDLTQKHADARLAWALEHRNWSWEQ
ncbi:hypothetical protein NA56DRAFT_421502 [Hyaloscypha hepaticicola]|uniref:Transposase Tc1-like domain-containing protein n=1 Tax=Hyaloscypha hepaticicola TaxID=2082293 RepID=A0A2J6PHR0_9HELO|nr:hypothetical protein NA56DRAFT_421502 [Hyaloscypha hepaticicola]